MRRPGRGSDDNGDDPDPRPGPLERLERALGGATLPDGVRDRMVEAVRRLEEIDPRNLDIRDLIFGDGSAPPGRSVILEDFKAPAVEVEVLSDLIAAQIRLPSPGKDRLFAVADGVLNDIRGKTPDRLPDRPLLTGKVGASLPLAPDAVSQLIRLAAARDLGPVAEDKPDPSVVWDDGVNQILVHVGRMTTKIGDGSVLVAIPVETDTIRTDMTVPFAVGSEKRVTGLVAAAPDRPAGEATIADVWGEALIALAYKALLDVADSLAGASGRDTFNNRLVPHGLTAQGGTLIIGTQAAYRFKGVAR